RTHRFARNLRRHLPGSDRRHSPDCLGRVSELRAVQHRLRSRHRYDEGYARGSLLHACSLQSQALPARHRLRHLLAGHHARLDSFRLPNAPAASDPPLPTRGALPHLILSVSPFFFVCWIFTILAGKHTYFRRLFIFSGVFSGGGSVSYGLVCSPSAKVSGRSEPAQPSIP